MIRIPFRRRLKLQQQCRLNDRMRFSDGISPIPILPEPNQSVCYNSIFYRTRTNHVP
ncbi:TPA: hypothetical protein ACQUHZ_001139 [Neisseria cinerea]